MARPSSPIRCFRPVLPGTRSSVVCWLAAGVMGCGGDALPPIDPEIHRAEVEAWQVWRHRTLQEPDGWLSLAGLYFLPEGDTRFGSAPEADFRYEGLAAPEEYAGGGVPALIGTFRVTDTGVGFEAAPGIDVRLAGEPVAFAALTPADDEPAVLSWGPLRWHVIERRGERAVRLRDVRSPVRTEFEGIDLYPVDTRWRVPGRFVAHDPPKPIVIPNIMGYESDGESPGTAVFEIEGREYSLDLWKDSDDPENFFTAFADLTNGDGTYGAGRFLWIDAPDESGRIVVDFNKAYNPPCVFTEFATCPLPPRQNRLPVRIDAGELEFHP